jgi:hypothetical protein
MKHDWPKNVLTFWRAGRKVRIHTTKGRTPDKAPDKASAPVYAESVNMLEGLTEEEADTFLQENLTLVPLYEIDVVKEAEPYQLSKEAAIVELAELGKPWNGSWRCHNELDQPNSKSSIWVPRRNRETC